MESAQWKPLELTCVHHIKDDVFGEFLAFCSLAPFAIIVSYVTLSLTNRDLGVIFSFAGQLINEFICISLKHYFKHLRPINKHPYKSAEKYGMPSQHAQFQAFFTAYCLLFLIIRGKSKPLFEKICFIICLIVTLIIVTYSRIYLVYHTWQQCLVGIIIGFIFGYLWFKIVYHIFEPNFFKAIASWKISKILNIKIENYAINHEDFKEDKLK